jgi:hypothetical protein
MQFFNLKGYVLNPNSPSSIGYKIHSSKPFANQNLIIPPIDVEVDFTPDGTAYNLLRHVYAAFGYSKDEIPFYNTDTNTFELV